MDAGNTDLYAENVLQLAGSLTSEIALTDQDALDAVTNARISSTIHLLELKKERSKVAGAQKIGNNAFYIQVTCDINAHVSAHQGTPPDGQTGQSGTNADDTFSLSQMVFESTDFDAPTDPDTSTAFTQKAPNNEANNKAWKTAGGATLNYKLPSGSVSLKMGHIAFNSNHFKVNVTIEATEAQAKLNQYEVADPVVTSSTGGTQNASTSEDITVAQYLYVSKSAAVENAGADTTHGVNNAALTAAGQDIEEAKLDSIRQASGQSNNWGKTEGAANIDQLEDKLTTSVSVDQVTDAYASALTSLKTALGGATGTSSIITSWKITVNAVAQHESSLLSKFGRDKGNIVTFNNDGNVVRAANEIFAADDKIVIGSFSGGTFTAATKDVTLKAREQKDNSSQQKAADTTILSGSVIALVCQKGD